MASVSELPTSDLRSEARNFSRDKDHRVKWAHGSSFGPGRRLEDNRPRPARIDANVKCCRDSLRDFHRRQSKARKALAADLPSASDSSADEDTGSLDFDECTTYPSVIPREEAEVTYSYDEPRGPSTGSQILGLALEKAIQRYEVRQTDLLIKTEYEVLDASHGDDEGAGPRVRLGKDVAEEDREYAFVEA